MVRENPFTEIKLLKHNRRVIETFSKEQIRILFDQPDLSTFTEIRDLTIRMLLLETGLRAKEIVSVDI
nr:hypothetical protein [Fredinandcohnia onubensis]